MLSTKIPHRGLRLPPLIDTDETFHITKLSCFRKVFVRLLLYIGVVGMTQAREEFTGHPLPLYFPLRRLNFKEERFSRRGGYHVF